MKIGIDLDDVVIDYMGGFCDFYNNKYGTDFSIEDFKSHNIWEVVGGTRFRAVRLVREFYKTKGFDDLKLIQGAGEGVRRLSRGNDLNIITARFIDFKEKTENYLKEHFGDLSLRVYSGFFDGAKKKSRACRELGVGLMIEDSKKYALACADKGVRVLLLDRPWNRNGENRDNITRVKNWNEILEKIGEIENE